MEITTSTATSGKEFAFARELMKEYAADIGVDLAFQDFENECTSVETVYARPDGVFVIAYHNGNAVGCFGIRKIDGRTCELKRMYLRKEVRGYGLGEKMLRIAIGIAGSLNYRHMRLDTLPTMNSAIRLYLKLGFKEIAPYRFNPIAGSRFMEIDLPGMDSERNDT